jgi:hypothetical protein
MKAISIMIPTSNIKPSVAIISPARADVTLYARRIYGSLADRPGLEGLAC